MKKNLFLFSLLLMAVVSDAQYHISGIVRDEKNKSLAAANVVLASTGKGTVTDARGFFQLGQMQAGEYEIQVSYVGYKLFVRKVQVSNDLYIEVSMVPDITITEEIIISATRAGAFTPVTYTNLSREDLKKENPVKDMPYLVTSVPSVVVSSDAGNGVGYTSIRIRGSDMNRINVTLNGVPVNDAESHAVYWVDIPDLASSVGQMQIQRGAGTSTNGAGAFGASINMGTTMLNKEPYGELNTFYGSFNTLKTAVSAGTGLINEHFVIDTRFSAIRSDGYIDRSASDLKSFYLSGGYHADKAFIKLNFFSGHEITQQAWNGVPKCKLQNDTALMQKLVADDEWSPAEIQNLRRSEARTFNRYLYKNQVDDYLQNNFQALASVSLADSSILHFTLHYTKGKGFYESYRFNRKFSKYGLQPVVIGANIFTRSDFIDRKWLDNDFYGFVSDFIHHNANMEFIAGLSCNQYIGRHFGRILWSGINNSNIQSDFEWYRSRSVKTDISSFVRINRDINHFISLFGDFQFRAILYSLEGLDDKPAAEGGLRNLNYDLSYTFLNPKMGMMIRMNENTAAYFSAAIAQREPNRNNIVDADPTKPLPKPEQMVDYELGFRMNKSRQFASVNIYYMYYIDQLVLTGEINDVGYPVMTNVPESYRLGLEMAGRYTFSDYFGLKGHLTLSQNKITSFTQLIDNWDTWSQDTVDYKNSDLSFSPAITGGIEFVSHPFRNFSAALIFNYTGEQFIDNTTNHERMLDAYLDGTLRLGYDFTLKKNHISCYFIINNLMNAEYETNAWVYPYRYEGEDRVMDGYFPQAPRHYLGGISIRF